MEFQTNDRVTYVSDLQPKRRNTRGTVVAVHPSDRYGDDAVTVRFDKDGADIVCYADSLELLHRPSDTVKVGDPRTPEKQYADSVDALLHEYAEKMRKGFDGGTMAWPYSHLGLLAEFLMEYNEIEKP